MPTSRRPEGSVAGVSQFSRHTHVSMAMSSAGQPEGKRSAGASRQAALQQEIVARVYFDIGEHAGQMRVTMVEGNTAASVVAYCCAALNDKVGSELAQPLQSSGYMLEVDESRYGENDPSLPPLRGYLYGLCDVLTHPDVKHILDTGRPLHMCLRELPQAHPNGMYFDDTTKSSHTTADPSVPQHYGSVPHAADLQQRSMLERAMQEEVQRELHQLDFFRPILGGDPLNPVPHTTASMQAMSRVTRLKERSMTAGERLSTVLDEAVLRPAEASITSDAVEAQHDKSGVAADAKPDSPVAGSSGHAASAGLQDPPQGSAALEHSGYVSRPTSPQWRAAHHPLPSRAADLLKHECDELKAALREAKEETRAVQAQLEDTTAARDRLEQELSLEKAAKRRAEEQLARKEHDYDDLVRARELVDELRADNARFVSKLDASAVREKKLQAEVLALQKELNAAECEAAAQLDKLLPTILTASTARLPPPPPPPSTRPGDAATPTRDDSPMRSRFQHITKVDPKLLQSPDTPGVELLPSDSLGTVVAKLTGKPALGLQVDKSLVNPLFQVCDEAEDAAASPPPGTPERGQADEPASPESGRKVQECLTSLVRGLEALEDGSENRSRGGSKQAGPTREQMLQQVSEIRTMLSVPQTPYSIPPPSGWAPSTASRPGGPGSPGGPLRSSSAYSYNSASLPAVPPPPPGPPPPHYSLAAAAFGTTRPPGL